MQMDIKQIKTKPIKNMKSIGIKLNQFKDFTTCTWVYGLISLSGDFFSNKDIIGQTLFLEFGPSDNYDHKLECLCEASGVDFNYYIADASIAEIREAVNEVIKNKQRP
jgi:hypothetical protein